MEPPANVLILGGTAEARELAAVLDADPAVRVISSLAGRVRQPLRPAGEVRIGGFDGPVGLAGWLAEHSITAVVDATHPFAAVISANAVAGCRDAGVALIRLARPGWQPAPGDDWHPVESGAAAARLLPGLGTRIFLSTGSYQLAEFAPLPLWFLLRSIEPPHGPLPERCQLLLSRGPFTLAGERELLREHRIDALVTKNSGGPLTSAKLLAARELRLPVVMISRPVNPDSVEVSDVEAAASAVRAITG
ncbi:MAG: cobalt-precorrin-6A reductase [Jatrophihabitans sp.]